MVKLHVHESAFAILKLKHAVKKSRCMQMLDGTQGTSTASIDIDVSQPARLHHLPLSPSPYLPALRMIGALDIVPPPVIVSSQRRLSHAGRLGKLLTCKHLNNQICPISAVGGPDVRRRPWPRFLRRSSQIRRAKRSPEQVCRKIQLRISSMASDRPMATMAARQSSAGEHGTLNWFDYKKYEVGIVHFASVAARSSTRAPRTVAPSNCTTAIKEYQTHPTHTCTYI